MYLAIKQIHMLVALLSISGFIFRAILAFRHSPLLQQKLARVLPHVNDSVLLLAGVYMVFTSGQYPWVAHWLGAKLLLLLAYIVLGAVTLKTGKQQTRTAAFLAAIGCFTAMVLLARFRPF